jgi:hypothetical protein
MLSTGYKMNAVHYMHVLVKGGKVPAKPNKQCIVIGHIPC